MGQNGILLHAVTWNESHAFKNKLGCFNATEIWFPSNIVSCWWLPRPYNCFTWQIFFITLIIHWLMGLLYYKGLVCGLFFHLSSKLSSDSFIILFTSNLWVCSSGDKTQCALMLLNFYVSPIHIASNGCPIKTMHQTSSGLRAVIPEHAH